MVQFWKNQDKLLLVCLVVLSIGAWVFSYSQNWVLAYNDSMSHLNMARMVVDNQKPGIAQIGSVWLPLSHVLALPLVWMNWAWQTGFAGSVVSMAAFVCTAIGIYAIVFELTEHRVASIIAAAATALNVNMLYLQTTPLTEPLYIALFVGAVYFLARYIKSANAKFLLPLTFLVALQVMTRYDGWFVGMAIGSILLVYEMRSKRLAAGKVFGNLLVYATPVVFAVLLWVAWNAVIFDDPFYFANGPFSARAQQEAIELDSGLVTKGSFSASVRAFGYSTASNVGWLILSLALIGWLLYLNPVSVRRGMALRMAVLGALCSVVVFNVLALVLGFSILNVPELHQSSSGHPAELLFNVRYGILTLPFVAVGVGLLASKLAHVRRLYVAPALFLAIIVQSVITYGETPITLQDGRQGASAFVEKSLADELKSKVQPGDDVLMSMSYFNPVAHASGLDLKQFIHEGTSRKWSEALRDPKQDAEWIVMSSGNSRDPVFSNISEYSQEELETYYTLEYKDEHGRIYRLANSPHPTVE